MKENNEAGYSLADLNRAYSQGLENAVVILEKSLDLSRYGRELMIALLKKEIIQDKVKAAFNGRHNRTHLKLVKR